MSSSLDLKEDSSFNALMIQPNKNVPTVMLLGRTNVGKSSLFNLLVGERQAIVSDIAGSTRDLVKREIQLAGYPCVLIDSGGFQFDDPDQLTQQAQEESWQQKNQSDLILSVLEAGSLTGADEELLQQLRPIANKVLLVVNKADTAELEMASWDVLAYGFPHLQPVSVKRHRNIGQLRRMILQHLQSLNFQPLSEPTSEKQLLRLALIGRPNSGKSTLLNSLAGTDVALVSAQAGTTRDALTHQGEWFNQAFGIIDTAGIRRKGKISEELEYYALQRSFQALDQADVAALLIDATQGITDQDKKIAARALDQGNSLIFVVNKIDLIDKEELHLLEENLRHSFPQLAYVPVLLISAKNKLGCKTILKEALSLYNQGKRRIPTSQLNQAVADWQLFQPIPQQGKTSYKIRYIVQQDTTPPHFIVFVNIVNDFPSSYRRYLINQLRREFGFPCVPISLELRQRQTWPDRQKQHEKDNCTPALSDREKRKPSRRDEQEWTQKHSDSDQRPSSRPPYREGGQGRTPRGERRSFNSDNRRSSSRPPYSEGEQGRAPRGERRSFNSDNRRSSSRPPYSEGEQGRAPRGERRSFNSDNRRSSSRPPYREGEQGRAPRGERRSFNSDNRRSSSRPPYREGEQGRAPRDERRSFNSDNRRSSSRPPYREGEQGRAPRDERRSFNSDNRRSSSRPPYREEQQGRAPRDERRSFNSDNRRSSSRPPYREGEQGRAPRDERRSFSSDNRRSSSRPPYREGEQGRAPRGERRSFSSDNRRSSSRSPYREGEQGRVPRGERRSFNSDNRRSSSRPPYREGEQGRAPRDERRSFNSDNRRSSSRPPYREGEQGRAPRDERRSFSSDNRRSSSRHPYREGEQGRAPRGERRSFNSDNRRSSSRHPYREGEQGRAPRDERRSFSSDNRRSSSRSPYREGEQGRAPRDERRSFNSDNRRSSKQQRSPHSQNNHKDKKRQPQHNRWVTAAAYKPPSKSKHPQASKRH